MKTWGDVLKDSPLLISLCVLTQFFVLVLVFSFYPSKMDPQAKMIILQTYALGFTAVLAYYLGLNNGKKAADVNKETQ